MRAVIAAAGPGRRLEPYTRHRPKPLLYVAGRPILGHVLDALTAVGLEDIVVVAGVLREQIAAYLETRTAPQPRLVVQDRPLGNGHAVHAARAWLDGPVLVVFGDTIPVGDLGRMVASETATIAVAAVDDGRTYGIVETDAQGAVRRLWEKPEVPPSRDAVAGLYYFPDARPIRDALDDLVGRGAAGTRRGEFWFTDALARMLDRGELLRTFRLDRFYDCGTPERLLEANRDLLAAEMVPGSVGGMDTPLETGAGRADPVSSGDVIIRPPCAIAADAVLREAVVGPFVTASPGTRIVRARVRDAVLLPGAVVRDAVVEHAIVDAVSSEAAT